MDLLQIIEFAVVRQIYHVTCQRKGNVTMWVFAYFLALVCTPSFMKRKIQELLLATFSNFLKIWALKIWAVYTANVSYQEDEEEKENIYHGSTGSAFKVWHTKHKSSFWH